MIQVPILVIRSNDCGIVFTGTTIAHHEAKDVVQGGDVHPEDRFEVTRYRFTDTDGCFRVVVNGIVVSSVDPDLHLRRFIVQVTDPQRGLLVQADVEQFIEGKLIPTDRNDVVPTIQDLIEFAPDTILSKGIAEVHRMTTFSKEHLSVETAHVATF